MKQWIKRGVLVIIVAYSGFVALGFLSNSPCRYPDANDAARMFVNNSMAAPLLKFKIDNGRYPTSEEGCDVLLQLPASSPLGPTWKGPYLKARPIDPWNQAYQYAFPATRSDAPYDLWSNGPDGVPSGDDLGNWD